MMFPVAILAGGFATRLRPITEKIPKALVEVAGRPFIAWQLDQLREEGVTQVVLCAGHLGNMIESVVGDGSAFGLSVSYSYDGDKPLGTGGALKKAALSMGSEFFVLYGDSYLPVNFKDIQATFLNSGREALMTVLSNQDRWDKSNVHFKDGLLVEYNKSHPKPEMCHIDYGLSIIKARCFQDYPEGQQWDLADLYYELSIKAKLAGYEVYNRFYEIGSHKGLLETENFLNKRIGK